MKPPKDAPKRIYLQHDPENTGEPFKDATDVTWCVDRINESDIAYIRADVAEKIRHEPPNHPSTSARR